jgi:hypothetical protein
MSADVTAFAIAALGLTGTVCSPIVTQRLALTARRAEYDRDRQVRDEERQAEEGRHDQELRREAYVRLNATARAYRLELMSFLFAIHRQKIVNEDQAVLREVRQEYALSVAEVQLIGSQAVLTALDPVHDGLSHAYGCIRQLEHGTPVEGGSFDELVQFLRALWDQWPALHHAMRDELGITR